MSVPWNGSGTTEARPPASSVPPAPHGGLGGLSRHAANPGPDFRSRASFRGEFRCRIPVSEHLFARWTTTTARLTDDAEAMGNDLDPLLLHRRAGHGAPTTVRHPTPWPVV